MGNPFAFLKFRIYRRTFFLYVAIMLLVIGMVSGALLFNAHAAGLDRFSAGADAGLALLEMRRQRVMTGIDRLFFRIYATRTLEDDFVHFFGATPEEYVQYRLGQRDTGFETYPEALGSLVTESGYSIRYVLHSDGKRIVSAQYSANGYSRYRDLTPREAAALEKGMLVYTKDVTVRSRPQAQVTFLIDLSDYAAGVIPPENGGMCYRVGEQGVSAGSLHLGDTAWETLLAGEDGSGSARLDGQWLFYWTKSVPQGGYRVAAAASRQPYLFPSLYIVAGICLCVVTAFGVITFLYSRQFTEDTHYLQKMLDSMARVQSGDFTPMELADRNDEFGQIAQNLNGLYRHLDLLIQQKYVLTINQQRTEMKMLSAQLNPHFLYNTLERIRLRALREGAPRAAEAAASLGQLYRNIVKTPSVIPMQRELEIAGEYLELMCFLYGEQMLYHIDADPRLAQTLTPKIWMQPILENFFKHNFREDSQIKVVVVEARRREGGIQLDFFDNLGSIPEEKCRELNRVLTPREIRDYAERSDKEVGLQNVYLRLHLYYGDRVSMELMNNQPAGVRIRIRIQDEEEGYVSPADCG